MYEESAKPAQVEGENEAARLAQMTLLQIEQSVGVLPNTLSHDQMLEWLMLATALMERAKMIRQGVEETAITWINSHGPLTNGPVTYIVGNTKSVKCTDILNCTKLLLDASGGDLNILCAHLVTSPFKHGSCHELLTDEQWRSVFREDWPDKIVLKSADARFFPRRTPRICTHKGDVP